MKKDLAVGQKNDAKKSIGQPANRSKISKSSSFSRTPTKPNGKAESQHSHSDQVSESGIEAASPATRRSINGNLSRHNFTVPQPFALATDKRASSGPRSNAGETPVQTRQSQRGVIDPAGKDVQVPTFTQCVS